MKTNTNKIIKTFFIICSFFCLLETVAQAPNKMSYQAVVRNASNALIANANVGIQISILQTSATGTAVFAERHTTTTNLNGLATIEIGGGTLVSGSFTSVNWANGPYFIKTETDPTGGTNYTISGTSQLLSVPFALFAANSGSNSNAWGINGNTVTPSNFIGTINDVDVIFKRNGVVSGKISNNSRNTSFGLETFLSITNGTFNTAMGSRALKNNTTGEDNTATGANALDSNTSGIRNTAHGSEALNSNSIGNSNTAVGSFTLTNVTTGSNNTAIGFNAEVASGTASNQVRIGNTEVTLASAQVAFTTTSDKRWKSNIKPSNLGLDFIKQLNPVFYTRKDVEVTDGKSTILESTTNPNTEYGFIAQELEATLNKFDAKNNGIISKDDDGMYGVRYNDLIAPMVKAIQEQQTIIEELKAKIEKIEKK